MTELMKVWCHPIATGGDTAMTIAADAMEDSNERQNVEFAELLRLFVARNNGLATPESAARYNELNSAYSPDKEGQDVALNVGPFWTQWTVSERAFFNNISFLDRHPIRELAIMNASPEIARYLTSHRMQLIQTLSLRMHYSRNWQLTTLPEIVKRMQGHSLRRLIIPFVDDKVRKLVRVMFKLNPTIRKGAVLDLNRSEIITK